MSVSASPRLLVTGATGQLGSLVIEALLKTTQAAEIAGMVRQGKDGAEARAVRLREQGVQTRSADYDDPASLRSAFAGVERLLFISSSATEGRVTQHRTRRLAGGDGRGAHRVGRPCRLRRRGRSCAGV